MGLHGLRQAELAALPLVPALRRAQAAAQGQAEAAKQANYGGRWVIRVERIGDATLYLGDCREILPTLSGVDAVVADPPYGIPHKFGIQRQNDGGRRTLQFEWDGPGVMETVFDAVDKSARLGMAHFWWCGLHQASGIADRLMASGMVPKPAAWVKECPAPAGFGTWWPSGFEIGVYAYRSGAWFGDTDKKRSNVFVSDSYRFGQPGKVAHPTQKPLGMMERIVGAIVAPDACALDPFMGSGTTGVACAKLGRRFIGIEIEKRYFDIACRRIEDAYKQADMFVARAPNPDVYDKPLRDLFQETNP